MHNQIKFSFNWNNKLNCEAFTTIRLHNPGKYRKNDVLDIFLGKNNLGAARIIDVKVFWLEDLNDFMAYLDTGYDKAATVEIIKKMYPAVNFKQTRFDFILLRKIKQVPQENLIKF